MSAGIVHNTNDHIVDTNHHQDLRRQSILSSSNPQNDSLPIDCILVYDRTEPNKDNEIENNNRQQSKKKKPSDRRRKFEEYLWKKQGLILNRVVSKRIILNCFFFKIFYQKGIKFQKSWIC